MSYFLYRSVTSNLGNLLSKLPKLEVTDLKENMTFLKVIIKLPQFGCQWKVTDECKSASANCLSIVQLGTGPSARNAVTFVSGWQKENSLFYFVILEWKRNPLIFVVVILYYAETMWWVCLGLFSYCSYHHHTNWMQYFFFLIRKKFIKEFSKKLLQVASSKHL